MRIDAHQHFWSIARGDYGWLTPDKGVLWRDYLPADLAPVLAAAGVEATLLVQAAPTEAETRFLLEIARQSPFVAGVVGWTDFAAPDAAARIAELASAPLLIGLRPMVQDIAEEGWIARADLAPAFRAMMAQELVFDALVLPCHLKPLGQMLDRHPDLTVVVDHAAKPLIAAQDFDPWRSDIAAIAARPNTFCKLSGLVTEAGPDWTVRTLQPVVEHLIEIFGPSRLIWGSDWPVVTLAADYATWQAAAETLLAGLAADATAAIFGGTAAQVYLTKRGRKSHAQGT